MKPSALKLSKPEMMLRAFIAEIQVGLFCFPPSRYNIFSLSQNVIKYTLIQKDMQLPHLLFHNIK